MFPVTDVQGAEKYSLSLSNLFHTVIQISIRILQAIAPLSFKQVMQNTPIHLLIAGIAFLPQENHRLFALFSILFSGIHGVYSYELHHSLTNRIPFQNRSRDIFLVDIDQEIQSIILEHNNENSSPAWFVDFLIIKFLTNQQEYL